MRNYCKNYAILKHPDAGCIAEVADEMNIIPSKDGRKSELFNLLEPNPYQDDSCEESYDWKIEHWGTQADAEIVDFFYDPEKDPNSINITFYTEWSPPIELYEYLCSEGWTVDAKFHEPTTQFVGSYGTSGEVYYDYDLAEGEQSFKDIPDDLIKFGSLRESLKNYLSSQKNDYEEGIEDDA
jgi:hypothetical protein